MGGEGFRQRKGELEAETAEQGLAIKESYWIRLRSRLRRHTLKVWGPGNKLIRELPEVSVPVAGPLAAPFLTVQEDTVPGCKPCHQPKHATGGVLQTRCSIMQFSHQPHPSTLKTLFSSLLDGLGSRGSKTPGHSDARTGRQAALKRQFTHLFPKRNRRKEENSHWHKKP